MIKARTIGNNIIIELTEENVKKLKQEGEKKAPEKKIAKNIPLYKGQTLEAEEKAKEAIYKVVAVSNSIATQGDIKVGEYVGIKNNTPIEAIFIEGVEYGVIPAHCILYISQ